MDKQTDTQHSINSSPITTKKRVDGNIYIAIDSPFLYPSETEPAGFAGPWSVV